MQDASGSVERSMKSVARVQSWMNLAAAADDFPSSSASAPACACACKRPFVTGRCASLFAVPCAYGRQDKPLSFAL